MPYVKFIWNPFTWISQDIFNVNFTWVHFYIKLTWKIHVKFPWKLLLLLLVSINIFSGISLVVMLSVHWFSQICRTMIYFSGDARFVSVTYRLFKLPPGTKGEPTQVIYNGQISGYEKEFRFDHQHVFKVCILGL